jgi:hypothetical protein
MLLHDIDISRGLLDPWTTLAAILGIILILGFAVAKARRFPLLSFAILFFFMNHLIEGTVIPLELIYEHRNYIPSMFFFVPIGVMMVRALDYFSYRRGIQFFMAGGFALRAERHRTLRPSSMAQQRAEGPQSEPPPHQPGQALL